MGKIDLGCFLCLTSHLPQTYTFSARKYDQSLDRFLLFSEFHNVSTLSCQPIFTYSINKIANGVPDGFTSEKCTEKLKHSDTYSFYLKHSASSFLPLCQNKPMESKRCHRSRRRYNGLFLFLWHQTGTEAPHWYIVVFAITGLRINDELLLLPCIVTVHRKIILQLLHLETTLPVFKKYIWH